ncbi:MAG: D-alanine--D-alanine ligase [Halieaceae bacterium]|jgi:D-alanine-D-alanine ligase|nr:D-alanine--D-alanine ligase [Halieaceae bacterium]
MSPTSTKQGPVAVLLGGTSAERDVSLRSGATIVEALKILGYEVRTVDPAIPGWMNELRGVHIAFNILHGPGGEDGTMQGALEALGVAYTGSGVLGSALAMDKVRSKQLWQGIGLATAGFEILTARTDWQEVIDQYGKVFVKPACEGSSIGMTAADSAQALEKAYRHAATYAGDVLAEQFIDGSEYTVAILGDQTLPSIRMETDNEFYDYDAKYVSEETRYFCPSGLTVATEESLSILALDAFNSLGCSGWGRVDMMRDGSGNFYVLEVNTIPGMTSHSLVPMAATAAGMNITALVQRIVDLSEEG